MVANVVTASPEALSPHAIKVLDLLTNRYHVGVIEATSAAGMQVVLPASSHLHAGQRVKFIVAGEQPLVARMSMRRGFVSQVRSYLADRLRIDIAELPETAVA